MLQSAFVEAGHINLVDAEGMVKRVAPRGLLVLDALTLPRNRVVVRCHPPGASSAGRAHLFCLNENGDEEWALDPFRLGFDAATHISVSNDILDVATWSCFTLEVDPDSGKVITSTFVK